MKVLCILYEIDYKRNGRKCNYSTYQLDLLYKYLGELKNDPSVTEITVKL